ncbi:MAG: hypothetical protein OXT69_12345 [Candidatus Poribacteria bacterium]|nr:hypothetical protein [Candidatus Poribacteria bacterium]
MNLDALAETIETLKKRILKHDAFLRESRTRTRAALVDPLLRALGWDTADPDAVLSDYRLNEHVFDYALLAAYGEPAALVQIKKLGDPLVAARTDLFTCAREAGIAYACLADGDKWELHAVDDQRLLSVAINDTPTHECALQLLTLWRPNLASWNPAAANRPFMASEPKQKLDPPPAPIPEPLSVPTTRPSEEYKWVALSRFLVTYFEVYEYVPASIRFPDESEIPIQDWTDLHVELAKWLHSKGLLTSDQMPIKRLTSDAYVANSEPIEHTGKDMKLPVKIAHGIYVSKHGSSMRHLENIKALTHNCGIDNSHIYLKRSRDPEPTPVPPTEPKQAPTPTPIPDSPSTDGWTPLPECKPPRNAPPPSAIRFPDGKEIDIRSWNDILSEIAGWLYEQGRLTSDKMPILSKSRKRFIVNSEPKSLKGSPMRSTKIVDGIFVGRDNGRSRIPMDPILLFEHCGVDPSKTLLRAADKTASADEGNS